ncbi:MAG: hypothetical protein GF388_11715, partial [Candidatus Aegiribacteria sp.]|nr:hypothetical protein [Candidatus Aegiribacteria sp.]
MKTIIMTLILCIAASLVQAVDPVIWPMSPQDGTHNLYHSYGDYHRDWELVTELSPGPNFHFGIDLTDPTPEQENDPAEDVYNVRHGYVRWYDWMSEIPDPPADHDNYAIVVCDDMTTEYGWSYQHVEDRLFTGTRGDPFSLGYEYLEEDRIGDIDNDASSQSGPGWTGDHLHFMWSFWEYSHNLPGYCNPLYYLTPEPSQSYPDFTWEWLCNPSQEYRFFAIPQYKAVDDWGSQWANVDACKSEIDGFQDNISGAVDLVAWFVVYGSGSTGSTSPRGVMPQRLEWWLERWDPVTSTWNEVQDISGSPYRRYPFDFGDIELGGASDWEKYKQLYFRFSTADFLIPSGTMCCLTNCSDNTTWDGIGNIEENYWRTDIDKELSESTNDPTQQLTPDGSYRIVIQSYVFDGVGNPPVALDPA